MPKTIFEKTREVARPLTLPDPLPVDQNVGEQETGGDIAEVDPYAPALQPIYDLTDVAVEIRDMLRKSEQTAIPNMRTHHAQWTNTADRYIRDAIPFTHVAIIPTDIRLNTISGFYYLWAGEGDRYPLGRFLFDPGSVNFTRPFRFVLPTPQTVLHLAFAGVEAHPLTIYCSTEPLEVSW